MKCGMSNSKIVIMLLFIGMALLRTWSYATAQSMSGKMLPQSHELHTTAAQAESPVTAPNLAEIVPLAAELAGRLSALENQIPDVNQIESQYLQLEADLKNLTDRLQQLKESNNYTRTKLVELKGAIKQENESFKTIIQPLDQAIRQLDSSRNKWLTEQKKWSQWQSLIPHAEQLNQLTATFEKTKRTIDTALSLISEQLEILLIKQAQSAHFQVEIKGYITELDKLLTDQLHGVLFDTSPPMFSVQYISQFSSDLWYAVPRGAAEVLSFDSQFFTEQGWIILAQVLLPLAVIVAVYRNRQTLKELSRWRFLVERPFAASLFFFNIPVVFLYQYEVVPELVKLANMVVVGICFIRISGILVLTAWRKHFVYGLTIIFMMTQFLDQINVPVPLSRLYTVITSAVAFLFCLRWTCQIVQHEESGLYRWLLRMFALLFAIIIIAEFWGKTSLALYLFQSLIRSIAVVLGLMVFAHMIHGGIEWLFRTALLQRASVLYSDTNTIVRRLARFIEIILFGLILLPVLLFIWGIYDQLGEATKGLLTLGFNWGSQRISVSSVFIALGIIYGSFLVSWIVQKLSMDVMFRSSQIDRGAQYSIKRLIHYAIIVVGFLLALGMLGFEATRITILLSALGVGIGFGLQGVVNNFVSGLILLFERPVRVGDTIELGGQWAEIRRIGLRSTIVKTFDEADVIVPNSDLISNQVTNWTLSNRLVRVTIPVGVAYGSDVPLVLETLAACAKDREKVATYPAPQVLFLSFGESSLDFELRCWVTDSDYRLTVISELHQVIDQTFREKKIEIAFPQRDLHLRSVDPMVIVKTSEAKSEGIAKTTIDTKTAQTL
jgi:small-conductance mechanosensitive channel